MTNDPLTFFCKTTNGNDLVPMLVVGLVFLAVYLVCTRLLKGKRIMKRVGNALVVLAVVAAVIVTVAVKKNRASQDAAGVRAESAQVQGLPRLVDLGADKCVPCKMMAPILEELRTNCAGRLDVEFIDVWKNGDAGEKYGIRVIPTQIFISAEGKELFRHEGFFSKEDILAKWKEFGVELTR